MPTNTSDLFNEALEHYQSLSKYEWLVRYRKLNSGESSKV